MKKFKNIILAAATLLLLTACDTPTTPGNSDTPSGGTEQEKTEEKKDSETTKKDSKTSEKDNSGTTESNNTENNSNSGNNNNNSTTTTDSALVGIWISEDGNDKIQFTVDGNYKIATLTPAQVPGFDPQTLYMKGTYTSENNIITTTCTHTSSNGLSWGDASELAVQLYSFIWAYTVSSTNLTLSLDPTQPELNVNYTKSNDTDIIFDVPGAVANPAYCLPNSIYGNWEYAGTEVWGYGAIEKVLYLGLDNTFYLEESTGIRNYDAIYRIGTYTSDSSQVILTPIYETVQHDQLWNNKIAAENRTSIYITIGTDSDGTSLTLSKTDAESIKTFTKANTQPVSRKGLKYSATNNSINYEIEFLSATEMTTKEDGITAYCSYVYNPKGCLLFYKVNSIKTADGTILKSAQDAMQYNIATGTSLGQMLTSDIVWYSFHEDYPVITLYDEYYSSGVELYKVTE